MSTIRYPLRYRFLAGAAGGVGLFVVVTAARTLPALGWDVWVLFGTMSVISAMVVFELPTGISFNPQSGILLAALFLFGWPVPVLLGALSLVAFWFRARRPFWRAAFDLGNVTLSLAVASRVAPAVLGGTAAIPWADLAAAGLLYAAANVTFTLAGRAARTGDATALTPSVALRVLVLSASMVPAGAIVALLYKAFGDAGALLGMATWLLGSVALKGSVEARAANRRLAQANRQLEEALVAVERLSITDPLTGLYNRRHFRIRLEEEFRREDRDATPFSLVLLDLVDFKAVNDRFGHLVGDLVLQQFARLLDGAVRPGDLVFRFGGDEFALILPRTDLEQGRAVASRLTDLMAQSPFAARGERVSLRVDAGIAAWPADGRDPDALVARADQALYEMRRDPLAGAPSPGSAPAG